MRSWLVVCFAFALAACTEDGGTGGQGDPVPPSLAVSPTIAALAAGADSVTITATLTNSSATVAWTLAGGGALSTTTGSSTTYTPPASLAAQQVVTVTASAVGLTAVATLTVSPAPSLVVNPSAAAVTAGTAAVPLEATLGWATGPIGWSLDPAVGALSSTTGATTSYLPPPSVGSAMEVTVTASAAGLSAKAVLTVKPAPIPALTVTASSSDTAVGGAAVQLEAVPSGGAAGTVVWSTPAAGTLAAAGNAATYTPPAALAAGTAVELTATLGGLVAHATVTVHLSPTLALPATADAIYGGAPLALAAVSGNASAPVTFAVTAGGGSVTVTGDTGSYVPPAECVYAGGETATVTATVAGYGGLSATAKTVIAVKQVGTLAIEPATLEVAAGDPATAVAALLAGGAHGPVRWTVYPANRGTVTLEEASNTSFAPPPAGGLVSTSDTTLYATAGCLTATARVVVHAAPLADALEVFPRRAVALPGGKSVRLETVTSPAGLVRTFTLTSGTGTLAQDGDAVVYTPPAQSASTALAAITVTAGTVSAVVPITTAGPEGIDVELFDPGDGWAIPSGKVMLGGDVQRVPASGRLTFHQVHPPYDVVFPFDGGAILGQGLTADRVGWGFNAARDTTLAYTVTGRTPGLSVRVSSLGAGVFDFASGVNAAGSLFASWSGPPSQAFDVFALEWQPGAGGAPVAWGRFGKVGPALTDQVGATTELALDGPAIASAQVSGTLSVPAGHVNPRFAPSLRLPGFNFALPFSPVTGGAWSYPAPDMPGVGFAARATAADAANDTTTASLTGIAPGDSGVTLALRAAPTAISPAAAATGIGPGDVLTGAGGLGFRSFLLFPKFPTTGPLINIFTSSDSATLPDLSAFGISLPSGGTYTWRLSYTADAKYTWGVDFVFSQDVGLFSSGGLAGTTASRTFVAR